MTTFQYRGKDWTVPEGTTFLELARQVQKDYKAPYYVDSAEGTNFRLAVYENGLAIDNLLDWAQMDGEGTDPRSRTDLGSFKGFVSSGSMALLYNQTPDELQSLSTKEIAERLYVIYKYYYAGRIVRVFLQKQTAAMSSSDMGGDKAKHSFDSYPEQKCYVTESELLHHALLEGIDFSLSIDGTLNFLHRPC